MAVNIFETDYCDGIHVGDKFLCFKTASYDDSNPHEVIFKLGKVYESAKLGCITDEGGNKGHFFTYPFWTQYLINISSKEIDLSPLKDIPLGDRLLITSLLKKYRNG